MPPQGSIFPANTTAAAAAAGTEAPATTEAAAAAPTVAPAATEDTGKGKRGRKPKGEAKPAKLAKPAEAEVDDDGPGVWEVVIPSLGGNPFRCNAEDAEDAKRQLRQNCRGLGHCVLDARKVE